MNQHPIDLLPASIRARSQAGIRAGQSVAAIVCTAIVLVILCTHSKFAVDRAITRRDQAKQQADYVLQMEQRADELMVELNELTAFLVTYERLAPSVDTSAILATIIDALPEAVALDRIDLESGVQRSRRNARSKTAKKDEIASRLIFGEIAGFAVSDDVIAQLVERLADTPPFSEVSLDFSRTREVYMTSAREFRVSFRIDLEKNYQVEAVDDLVVSADADSEE